jgi:uncharacterized membrane protein YvbJ
MVYCSNCGSQIADDANFCPKCGTRTVQGRKTNASRSSDELQDVFYRVGIELEKAFTIAAHETHAALKKAKENMEQKTASQTIPEDNVVCPHCGKKNIPGAIFCNSCGKRLSPEASGSA